MQRAALAVYVRRFLLGCVWSLAVMGCAVAAGRIGALHSTLGEVLPTAAVFPAWFLVGAIRHVRYVGYRVDEPEPGDLSRRPGRDLSLPGLDLARAREMVRELDRDSVLQVEEVEGGFVIRAGRGGTWSRATAHVSLAAQPETGADTDTAAGGAAGIAAGIEAEAVVGVGVGAEGDADVDVIVEVERVDMRIEGSIPFVHGTDDGRAFFLVLQLCDYFVDELRAHLISSPTSPRKPETAGR